MLTDLNCLHCGAGIEKLRLFRPAEIEYVLEIKNDCVYAVYAESHDVEEKPTFICESCEKTFPMTFNPQDIIWN